MDPQSIARTMLSLSVDESGNPTICIIQHEYHEGLIHSCVDIQLDTSSFSDLLFQMRSLEIAFNQQKQYAIPMNSPKNIILEIADSPFSTLIKPAGLKRGKKD